jgi:hypothetical protein
MANSDLLVVVKKVGMDKHFGIFVQSVKERKLKDMSVTFCQSYKTFFSSSLTLQAL